MERLAKYSPVLLGIIAIQLCLILLLGIAFVGQQFAQGQYQGANLERAPQFGQGQGLGSNLGQPPQFAPGQGQSQFSGPGQQFPQDQNVNQNQGPRSGQGQPPSGQQLPGNQPNNRSGNGLNQPTGDRVGGRVTAVSGSTITVENPQGTATIVTSSSTKFTADGQTSSLTGVTVGKFVNANAQKQSDGTWVAAQVNISDRPPQPPQGQQPGTNPNAP